MIPKTLRTCRLCGAKTGTKDYFGPCPNPACIESPFRLENSPPKPEPYHGEPAPQCRQKVLFTGLSLLPGQLDLFDETPETPRSLPCDCQANTNRPA
jgi:hypothetical protein